MSLAIHNSRAGPTCSPSFAPEAVLFATAINVLRDTLIDFGDLVEHDPDSVAVTILARLRMKGLELRFREGERT